MLSFLGKWLKMIPSCIKESPFFQTPPTNLNHAHPRPKDTPFEDGTFKLTMEFTEEYPNKPPTVRFVSKMFHPNGINTCINYVHTHICTHARIMISLLCVLFFYLSLLLFLFLVCVFSLSLPLLFFPSFLLFVLFFCPLFFLVFLNLYFLSFLF